MLIREIRGSLSRYDLKRHVWAIVTEPFYCKRQQKKQDNWPQRIRQTETPKVSRIDNIANDGCHIPLVQIQIRQVKTKPQIDKKVQTHEAQPVKPPIVSRAVEGDVIHNNRHRTNGKKQKTDRHIKRTRIVIARAVGVQAVKMFGEVAAVKGF